VSEKAQVDWNGVLQRAPHYPQAAFLFVREGLQHTVNMVYGSDRGRADQHVNGQQLCIGLRDYAIDRFGMLARLVLHRWGITRTDDFGRIVFAMIEGGLMRKSDEDSFEDFQGVYDFDEAFGVPAPC